MCALVHQAALQRSHLGHCPQNIWTKSQMIRIQGDGHEGAPLYTSHFLVAFFRELTLHSNHSFETGVEIRNTELEEPGQFPNELIVQKVKYLFCVVVFLLSL
jgi:hypothetical protein